MADRYRYEGTFFALLCVLGSLLAPATPAFSAVLTNTQVVAKSGDRSPDNTGNLSELKLPVLQSDSRAAFTSVIREDGFLQGDGIFLSGQPGGLRLLVRSGQPSPDGNGNLGTFGNPDLLVNSTDTVAFMNLLDNTFGILDHGAIFVASGNPTTLAIVARESSAAPNGQAFNTIAGPLGLNSKGQVAFFAGLTNGFPGLFRGAGSPGTLVQIVLGGQPTATGNEVFLGTFVIPPPTLNESGQVAFSSAIQNSASQIFYGIFRSDGVNPIREIVREGNVTPSGNGSFSALTGPLANIPINDNGKIAFLAALSGTVGGQSDNLGIFMGDGTVRNEIVRRGRMAPDGNGQFLNFGESMALNNADQVFFLASLTGASGGANTGLFIATPSSVKQIARANGPAPGGGLFSSFLTLSGFNRRGEALFSAMVDLQDGPPTNDQLGIFLYDGTGLKSVARVGDTIPNHGIITDLALIAETALAGSEGSALNEGGQVTYRFTTGGNFRIAIWSGPPLFTDGFESGNLSSWSLTP